MTTERLQKVIAASGYASRRKAEKVIEAGRVTVNGETVTDLGVKVNITKDIIEIDGKSIFPQIKKYILLNKPKGYLSTVSDERGRKTVIDLVSGFNLFLKPVGRLDLNTEGLLLLTNDGELAFRLSHPRFEVIKRYVAIARGKITQTEIDLFSKGIELEEGLTAPAKAKLLTSSGEMSTIEISIHEGRKRQIRRMLEAIGHPVVELKRVEYAGLEISDHEHPAHTESSLRKKLSA